jgi:micrococcal nuclease
MRWHTLAGLAAGAGALAWGVGAMWPAGVPADAPSGIVQPLIVERVLNGDTLVLDSPQGGAQIGTVGRVTVRLLGLDAPDPGVPNECFAITSRGALTSLLPPGSLAWVLTDEVPQDPNGMWLAWVWTSDGTFVNQVLAANGLARVSDPTPNTSRWPEVAQAAEQAYRREAGLWAECSP